MTQLGHLYPTHERVLFNYLFFTLLLLCTHTQNFANTQLSLKLSHSHYQENQGRTEERN